MKSQNKNDLAPKSNNFHRKQKSKAVVEIFCKNTTSMESQRNEAYPRRTREESRRAESRRGRPNKNQSKTKRPPTNNQ
jgi:hypothetical protein